ncbi:hypothetical protein CC99x_009190 [Candidatus Berkiella cookevillensis]|uniref:Protein translocase subunit SecA n=1 Tax=Candidatus Berkiella cookevillensis TaxID=437022 RepID=A0A0Q9YLA2_9GAMM|nr:DEAD/DEAH box helicase [Candidatus Berkiella cookevillensis]MCS5709077.1 hypothetical protein [Candidatus Berkiella cookevillensis]
MPKTLSKPILFYGDYPQKSIDHQNSMDDTIYQWFENVKNKFELNNNHINKYAEAVISNESDYASLSEAQLSDKIMELRNRLYNAKLQHNLIIHSFAIIRECAFRTLGIRHHHEQIMGGFVLLQGMLAEMQTGEGKTLTATLAAITAALQGIPVHVVSANQYLAKRDADTMKILYHRLGLQVSYIQDCMSTEEKKTAFQANITYCTSSQLAFCYLHDYIARDHFSQTENQTQFRNFISLEKSSDTILRGLCFAIVDEADTVLIDEAKTPLILAKESKNISQIKTYKQALSIAELLTRDLDFLIQKNDEFILTTEGKRKITFACQKLKGIWSGKRNQEFFVKLALTSKYLFIRDRDYIVSDNKITILNKNTGRLLPNSTWEHGIHQMIELRENCAISNFTETIARITYQSFFNRYLHLSGMSGTLKDISTELQEVYKLFTVVIPTHKPCLRHADKSMLFKNLNEKYSFLMQRIIFEHNNGRPILIGTHSISESEFISSLLMQQNIKHVLLNAKQDSAEAFIIQNAGQPSSITIATNMAGRGTDIKLGFGVNEKGGLFVISAEMNPSRRIDRQLFGRTARQGEAGASQCIYSLEDTVFKNYYAKFILKLLSLCFPTKKILPHWLAQLLIYIPQWHSEYKNKKLRLRLMRTEKSLSKHLSFTGNIE